MHRDKPGSDGAFGADGGQAAKVDGHFSWINGDAVMDALADPAATIARGQISDL